MCRSGDPAGAAVQRAQDDLGSSHRGELRRPDCLLRLGTPAKRVKRQGRQRADSDVEAFARSRATLCPSGPIPFDQLGVLARGRPGVSGRGSSMTVQVRTTAYGRPALEALRAAVAKLQEDDPMAPVTVLVPNNIAGIVARRFLAHGLTDDSNGINTV